eukprot:COSAG04_NODE_3174_length_3090_cov_1.916750_6_plen_91_part_00
MRRAGLAPAQAAAEVLRPPDTEHESLTISTATARAPQLTWSFSMPKKAIAESRAGITGWGAGDSKQVGHKRANLNIQSKALHAVTQPLRR